VIAVGLLLLIGTAGGLWLRFGPHRGLPEQALRAAAEHGLSLAGGTWERGWFSSSLRGATLSSRRAPGSTVEIGILDFEHAPFVAPRVTVREARAKLGGEPVPLLTAITEGMSAKLGEITVERLDVDYRHRLLGHIRFEGVTFSRSGPGLLVAAKRVRARDFSWPDVRLAVERRKDMFVIRWDGEVGSARLQLSCFPPAEGSARWLFDVIHQPARPLLARLGWDLGDGIDGAKVAGGISLDVPEDPAKPPQGRVQLVFDGWPLGAPAESQALLGRTFSILSNLAAAVDGARWELPRVHITMPVFSLVGQGHVEVGRRFALALEAQGERSCRELRALLPPSPEHDQVQRFLAAQPDQSRKSAIKPPPPARLELRVRAGGGSGYRSEWKYLPGCGLQPWEEQTQ
jgi:hypothetical protein